MALATSFFASANAEHPNHSPASRSRAAAVASASARAGGGGGEDDDDAVASPSAAAPAEPALPLLFGRSERGGVALESLGWMDMIKRKYGVS